LRKTFKVQKDRIRGINRIINWKKSTNKSCLWLSLQGSDFKNRNIMKLLIGLLLVLSQFTSFSQTFEGTITMKITYADMPEDMQAYESMMPTEMITQISGMKTRVTNESAFGSTIAVYDNATQKGFILMDMMGQKMMTRTDVSDEDADDASFDVKKTTETKMIAGYSCTKYVVTNSESTVMDIWTTDGLNIPKSNQGLTSKAPGFPMEYSSVNEGITTTMTVSEVKKETLSPTLFVEPTEGYTVYTEEELLQMGGN
jgi:hypothetical protein